MASKGAVKTVRFTPEVEAFIKDYRGTGFTGKLTNIVVDVMVADKAFFSDVEALKSDVASLQSEKDLLCNQIDSLQRHYNGIRRKFQRIECILNER